MDESRQPMKQRSLLEKYEIPLDHLSYEYIGNCKDIRELEKILKILRSGEEGYYPDLQNAAEESLRFQSPNNRLLRQEQPALTRSTMSREEWNNIASDLSDWKEEVSEIDQRLMEENNNTMDEIALPPVRQPAPATSSVEEVEENKAGRTPRVSDYAAWDKYDVATELLKVDLEEEREEEKKKQQIEEKPKETDWLEQVKKDAEKLTRFERMVFAKKEKLSGNEYYKTNNAKEAIKHYTASIAVWPTVMAYNNRAACYLRESMYAELLEDTNKALELEPGNVKAHYRRSIGLQYQDRYKEALEDMEVVVKAQPRNHMAVQLRNELKKLVNKLPENARFVYEEGPKKPKLIEIIDETETIENRLTFEVNETGLSKNVCIDRLKPLKRAMPAHTNTGARIVELDDEPEVARKSTKLKIVEVENSEINDLFGPTKCVFDKRTQRNTNADPTNLGNEEPNRNQDNNFVKRISESGAEEDVELGHSH